MPRCLQSWGVCVSMAKAESGWERRSPRARAREMRRKLLRVSSSKLWGIREPSRKARAREGPDKQILRELLITNTMRSLRNRSVSASSSSSSASSSDGSCEDCQHSSETSSEEEEEFLSQFHAKPRNKSSEAGAGFPKQSSETVTSSEGKVYAVLGGSPPPLALYSREELEQLERDLELLAQSPGAVSPPGPGASTGALSPPGASSLQEEDRLEVGRRLEEEGRENFLESLDPGW